MKEKGTEKKKLSVDSRRSVASHRYRYISIYIWFGLHPRPTSRNPIDFRRRRRRRRQIIKEEEERGSSSLPSSLLYSPPPLNVHSMIDWGKKAKNKSKMEEEEEKTTQNEREKRREKWRDFARLVSFLLFSLFSILFFFILSTIQHLSPTVILGAAGVLLISKPQPTPLLTPPRFSPPPLLPSLSNNVTYYKKKREKEKKEKRVERGWLRFDYAFHHHRLHMRSDSSFVFILIPFFGEGWGALLLSFMYVYAGLIYFRENKFQTKLKAAIIILLFSKK